MAGSTRRTLLARLLGTGMAGSLALRGKVLRAADEGLRLPATEMLLERSLVRGLGGSAAITVRREWRIAFSPQGRGAVVTGTQVGASVDAPPALAELARLEQQREEQGLFPIMLSDTGLIVSHGRTMVSPTDLAAVVRTAEALVARLPGSPSGRDAVRRYLAEMDRAGAGQFDRLPADLLFPSGSPLHRIETVALPEGRTGQFELTWEARKVAGAGWLAEGQRRVITRLEGMERRSLEVWRLRPA